jgi:hypothetical protein
LQGISPTLIIVRVATGGSYEYSTSAPGSRIRFVGGGLARRSGSDRTANETRETDLEMSRTQKEGSSISLAAQKSGEVRGEDPEP